MKPSRPTIALFATAVLVALVMTAVAMGHERQALPRDKAMTALDSASGSSCERIQFVTLAYDKVDKAIEAAAANAGWIDDKVFVGELAAAAPSRLGMLVAESANEAWLLVPNKAKERLLGLAPRTAGGRTAFVVTQIIDPC